MRGRSAVAGCALAVTTAVSAWPAGAAPTDGIGADVAPTEACVPTKDRRAVYVSVTTIAVPDGTKARIDNVRLTGAKGLRLTDSYLVPLQSAAGPGVIRDPARADSVGLDWDDRIDADGAQVRGNQEQLGLLLKVRRTDVRGTSRSIEVAYTANGRSQVSRFPVSVILRRSECPL